MADNNNGPDVSLVEIQNHMGKSAKVFKKAVLSSDGISIRQYDRLVGLVYSHVASESECSLEWQSRAIKLLDEAAFRRVRKGQGLVRTISRVVLSLFALIALTIFVAGPVDANAPSEEAWYQTAIAYTKAALDWMNIVQEGLNTISKGVEYMTKVMDNNLGAMFDLQTEQYNKAMAASGTQTEMILTQMENQQKAWVRLGSRPGGDVCVDGALYGGFLGLKQSIAGGPQEVDGGELPPPSVPSIFEAQTDESVAADVKKELTATVQDMAVRAKDNNPIHKEALAVVVSQSEAVSAAQANIEYISRSSKTQDELGVTGTQASDVLMARLEDIQKDPNSDGGEAVVSDTRLQMLSEGRVDLMKSRGWDKSMSQDDYYEFLVMQYQIPEFGEFIRSSGPGSEPLLREMISQNTALLQLQLENNRLLKMQLELRSKEVVAASTMPDSKKATRDAYNNLRATR